MSKKKQDDGWVDDPTFKPSQDDGWVDDPTFEVAEESVAQGVLDSTATSLRSALEGMTAGLSEPIVSGTAAILDNSVKSFSDADSIGDFAEKLTSKDRIMDRYQEDVDRRKALKERYAAGSATGEVAGALVPSPLNVGNKIFKAGNFIADGIKGAGTTAKLARAGTAGATSGLGYESVKQLSEATTGFQDPTESFEKIRNATLFGGGFGAGASAVGSAASSVVQKAPDAAKKLLASQFGVSEKNIDKYLKNNKEINKDTLSEESLYEVVQDRAIQIRDDLSNAKISQREAAAELKGLTSAAADEFRRMQYDAKDAFKESRALVDKAVQNAREQASYDIVDFVGKLKGGLSKQSNEAWAVLENSKEKFPVARIKGLVTQALNQMKIGGKDGAVVGDQAKAAARSLQSLRDDLDGLPKDLSMSELKSIIQGLDNDIDWTSGLGHKMDAASANKLQIRRSVDDSLKMRSPEYLNVMQPLAQDAKLLSEITGAIKDQPGALRALNQAAEQGSGKAKEIIEKLSARSGKNFLGAVDEAGAPDFPKLQAAKEQMEALAHPDAKGNYTKMVLDKSGALKRQQDAENHLLGLTERYDKLKRLTNRPDETSEKVLDRVLAGRGTNADHKLLEDLSKEVGVDLTKHADNLSVLRSFEKGDRQGSKNVNWATFISGAFGLTTGGVTGGAAGLIAGPVFGKIQDTYGPKMAKVILDQVIKLGDKPSVQQINALSIPEAVKKQLVDLTHVSGRTAVTRPGVPTLVHSSPQFDPTKEVDGDEAKRRFIEGN